MSKELSDLIDYDPLTGVFKWKVNRCRVKAGDIAGSLNELGYRRIVINGKRIRANRLAWFLLHGAWPAGFVDHINGVVDDNRIENLRDVPLRLNTQNQRKPQKHNKSGFLGVQRRGNRFQASLTFEKKTRHIGFFGTPQEAHAAYVQAKRSLHPGCTL